MYPIHPKLAMDIAISTGIADRKQEWPDDPNGTPVRRIEMPQDPLFMGLRSVRMHLATRLGRLFTRTHEVADVQPNSTARILPIAQRSDRSDADCTKAA